VTPCVGSLFTTPEPQFGKERRCTARPGSPVCSNLCSSPVVLTASYRFAPDDVAHATTETPTRHAAHFFRSLSYFIGLLFSRGAVLLGLEDIWRRVATAAAAEFVKLAGLAGGAVQHIDV
jgi:hypothetical protein